MDIFSYNRKAWDREVEKGNEWTQPVSSEIIAEARPGTPCLILMIMKMPIPPLLTIFCHATSRPSSSRGPSNLSIDPKIRLDSLFYI
jgi:hypothetical protein